MEDLKWCPSSWKLRPAAQVGMSSSRFSAIDDQTFVSDSRLPWSTASPKVCCATRVIYASVTYYLVLIKQSLDKNKCSTTSRNACGSRCPILLPATIDLPWLHSRSSAFAFN
jgi:hypothetical protein